MIDELAVRRQAMAYVAERSERGGGVIRRDEVETFAYGGEQFRLIDYSRGTRAS